MIRGYDEFELLGRGGFATVYRARQIGLPRQVAVKILDARNADDRQMDLFTRECMAMASLSGHPHVVEVYDAGRTDEGRPYLAMQLLPGGSLADAITEGPMPLADAVRHMADVADALDAAHALGVLHRDIKPANILIDRRGRARLADFGIARMADSSTTAQGAIGTPLYMAPEVLNGGKASAASDIYGLGAALITVLHGRHPFEGDEGEGAYGSLWKLISGPSPTAPEDTPTDVVDIVDRCVAKDPADRFATAADVHATLAAAATALAAAGTGETTVVTGRPSSAATRTVGSPPLLADTPAQVDETAEAGAPHQTDDAPVTSRPRRRRAIAGAAIAAVVLLLAGTAFALAGGEGSDPEEDASSSTTLGDGDALSLVEDRVEQAEVGIDRRYDLVDDATEIKVSTTLTNDTEDALTRIWFEAVPSELDVSLDELAYDPQPDGSVEEKSLLYWVVELAAGTSETVSWTAPVPADVVANERYLDRFRRLQRNATVNAEAAITYTTTLLERTTDAVGVTPTAGEGGTSEGPSDPGSEPTGGGGSGEGSGDEVAAGGTTTSTPTPTEGSGGGGPSQQQQQPPANRAPTVTVTNQTSDELAPVRYTIAATDPDGHPLDIRVSGLPPGLSANGATISGTVSHNASAATTTRASIRSTPRTVTVTVDDGHDGRVSRSFTWTVRDTHVVMQSYIDQYGCARGPRCDSTNTIDVAAISQYSHTCAYVPGASGDLIHRQSVRPGTVIRWGAPVTYWYARDDTACATVAKGYP